MNYKLKAPDGHAKFLLKTGEDFVHGEMTAENAQTIIDEGKEGLTTKAGYPINVNDEWFFEGIAEAEEKAETESEKQEDPAEKEDDTEDFKKSYSRRRRRDWNSSENW